MRFYGGCRKNAKAVELADVWYNDLQFLEGRQRKAGAGGGTIIGARGTVREEDAAFFGMKIVPEKDMLIILVPTEKKDDILKAITDLPCFAEAGSGIIFCNEAKDFTLLGKK